MPKRLDIGIVVGDQCNQEEILNLLNTVSNSGYFVIRAKLENELNYSDSEGFTKVNRNKEPDETTTQIRLKNKKTGKYFFKTLTQKELDIITNMFGKIQWS
ncbi:hypothetical protein [Clostridium gasigenes]|uniref:Uncharacterized protein n=1 Tax=Clostridium gasigenes TaxID=94869 RepID=A0A1H0M6C5_9CLOT|nr:hypothetical protein [Clostridium gasigenes]SDO76009.1 hypothetical protein SAMN04488529_101340 [Clostridium gasigenes]